MGSSDFAGIACAFCCFIFLPFVFQSIGLFTPNWVKTSECSSTGLVYSCCSGDNNDTCKNTNGGDDMGSSDFAGIACAFCCFIFLPFVFQSIGLFTPNWVKTSECSSTGLVYSCCSGDNNDTCKNTNGGDDMGSSDFAGIACAFCCFIFLPFVFQSIGLFTPNWVKTSECSSTGLVYSCCSGDNNDTCKNTNGGDELDARVLGLEATAFAVMFLAVFGTCYETCCSGDDEGTGLCGIIGGCCLIMFPVAGLFSFIGCMIIAANYSTSELGWSLYLCLTSGCMIIVMTGCLCCCFCKALKNEDDEPVHRPSSGRIVPYEGSGGVAPYGGGAGGVAVAQVEQRAVVHDPESGGLLVVMRKFTIAHIVHNLHQN